MLRYWVQNTGLPPGQVKKKIDFSGQPCCHIWTWTRHLSPWTIIDSLELWIFIACCRASGQISLFESPDKAKDLWGLSGPIFKNYRVQGVRNRVAPIIYLGAFNNSSLQLNLRTICKGLSVGSHVSSAGISKLLKPTRFFTLLVLTSILMNSGDIERNPGPTFSITTVQGSCHQANLKFGPTSGTQCVCNSLASLCFSNIKPLRNWRILTLF